MASSKESKKQYLKCNDAIFEKILDLHSSGISLHSACIKEGLKDTRSLRTYKDLSPLKENGDIKDEACVYTLEQKERLLKDARLAHCQSRLAKLDESLARVEQAERDKYGHIDRGLLDLARVAFDMAKFQLAALSPQEFGKAAITDREDIAITFKSSIPRAQADKPQSVSGQSSGGGNVIPIAHAGGAE